MLRSDPPQYHIEKPIFAGAQNVLVRCQVTDCVWEYVGPRESVRHAWNEHYRMEHVQEEGVMSFTPDLRERLWLPTTR